MSTHNTRAREADASADHSVVALRARASKTPQQDSRVTAAKAVTGSDSGGRRGEKMLSQLPAGWALTLPTDNQEGNDHDHAKKRGG